MESKREKFVRLATIRTNELLDRVRILGNLSNTGRYDYADKDMNKIFGEIDEAIREMKSRFRKKTKRYKFKLE